MVENAMDLVGQIPVYTARKTLSHKFTTEARHGWTKA